MTEFKVGDRVAVYGANQTGGDKIHFGRKTGTVIAVHDGGSLQVQSDSGNVDATFHPKQCRRLKKRERRRVWIREDCIPGGSTGIHTLVSAGRMDPEKWTEFVEVRRKK